MKRLLVLIAFLATIAMNAQIAPFNVAELKGITTAIRDAYTPPAGTFPIIYNVTDNEHQKWNGSEWEAIGSGAGGGSDGNDFLTSVTNVDGVLTFVVSNQTDPTLDINDLDNYTGAELESKLDAYFGNSNWRTQDGTGTDSQTLSFTSPNLSISGGNSVNLSALQDGTGTDDQNAAEVALTSAVNGETTVQASLEDHESRIDALAGGGADGVITDITLVGTTLQIDGTGGAETVDVDLSSLQDGTGTDNQTLSFDGTNLSIESGNSVNLSGLSDGTGTDDQTATEVSYSNTTSGLTASQVQAAIDEIEARVDLNDVKVTNTDAQTLSLTGTTLSISGGNNQDLSSLQDGGATSLVGLSDVTLATNTNRFVLIANGSSYASRLLTEADISDLGNYLTSETNDLTSAVTWANVPDINITQSSVTQHQAALSITESQISDFGTYLTSGGVNIIQETMLNVANEPIDGYRLEWDNSTNQFRWALPGTGSPNTNAGQKAFTTIDGTTTPTYTLASSDFAPGGADEGKISFIIVQDTVVFTAPVITSTTKSLIVKGELNAKATFKAGSSQLFWIADENQYVNAFDVDNMNAAAITPVSATLYSVEGNVRGFNEDTTGPGAVGSLAASNIQSTSARITFTHATDDFGVSYYELSTDGSNFTNIGYVTQYDVSGLTANTQYTVTVRGVDTSGNLGATATVTFTTAANFTLVTDSNSNPNIFSNGAGSNIANDTGLYDSGVGDHFSPVNIQSQSAVVTTVNGYTHAHRIVSDGSQFSRIRAKFNNATTTGAVYEWDFIYRMTDGGQYGAVNVDGTTVSGLNATDWTVVSGESTAGNTTLDVEVYASNNAAANPGEAIEWIIVVKEKEADAATKDPSTTYAQNQINASLGPLTNVYDGNTATWVESYQNTQEKWISIDLGTAKAIGYIELSTRSGFGTRLNDVNIQVSNDAINWTTDRTTGTAFTGTGIETQTFDLVDQTTPYRYIRIQKPADTVNVLLSLSEFYAYTFN